MLTRPEKAAGLLALVLGLLHWWLLPESGTDLAAQLARESFAREAPLTPVDLSWYGGVHPYGYSLLSPWLMALLGVHLSGVLAAVLGSMLLARLFRHGARPWSASLIGAVFLVANVASGRTTFALGATAGLATLVALPRVRRSVVFAVLTALLSPVAAAFLGLAAAVLVLHRRPGGWRVGLVATAPVVALAVLFPGGGVQPFTTSSARPALLVAGTLALLSTVPIVRTAALLYGLAVVGFVLHDDPFGSNVLRLGLLVAAPVLLAAVRGRGFFVALALAGFLSWQIGPPSGDLQAERGPSLVALRAELQALGATRVEVVAPRDHAESAYVAEKVPLARGWARQQDYVLNPLFYKGTLTGPDYLDWLRERAVSHVAVPQRGRIDFGSTREAALFEAGPVAGLEQVWSDEEWVVYAIAEPVPIATPGVVLSSTRTALRVLVEPGTVDVRVRWSRWLTVTGPACLQAYGDQVRLRVSAPGAVVISSSLRPRGHCEEGRAARPAATDSRH